MDAQSLNIALLPDEEITKEAIILSKKISESIPTEFVLDGKNFYPHLTIYQAHFPTLNLEQIKRSTEKLIPDLKKISLHLSSIEVTYTSFLWWSCRDFGDLTKIHYQALELLNPLREGLIMPQLSDRGELPDEMKQNIKKYGSMIVDKQFVPHITLARLSDPQDASEVPNFLGEKIDSSFKPKSLVIGILGKHGTLTQILEEFLL